MREGLRGGNRSQGTLLPCAKRREEIAWGGREGQRESLPTKTKIDLPPLPSPGFVFLLAPSSFFLLPSRIYFQNYTRRASSPSGFQTGEMFRRILGRISRNIREKRDGELLPLFSRIFDPRLFNLFLFPLPLQHQPLTRGRLSCTT